LRVTMTSGFLLFAIYLKPRYLALAAPEGVDSALINRARRHCAPCEIPFVFPTRWP
jgi:hypothetical protein